MLKAKFYIILLKKITNKNKDLGEEMHSVFNEAEEIQTMESNVLNTIRWIIKIDEFYSKHGHPQWYKQKNNYNTDNQERGN